MSYRKSKSSPTKGNAYLLQSASTRVLIRGGRVVNDDMMMDADVYIEDGIIKWVGRGVVWGEGGVGSLIGGDNRPNLY